MAIMTELRFRHLPVLDDDRELVGVVSIGDVVKFQSQERGSQIKFLTEFIQG
jgi:CBS domain-containing protein